jgi:hypothetical protein
MKCSEFKLGFSVDQESLLISAILQMTKPLNLAKAKTRISGYLTFDALFTENR